MASIHRYKDRGWQVRWRTPDRKDRSKVFARKGDAEAFRVSVEHAKGTGAYVDPQAGRTTLRAYAEEWRKAQAYRPATATLVEKVLRLHVYPILGDRPLRSIRHSDIQGWVTGISATLAPSTVQHNYIVLAGVLKGAVRDRLLAVSPCVGTRCPTVPKRPVMPLSANQVARWARGMPPRYRALIHLGIKSGLRINEAVALTVDRVQGWMTPRSAALVIDRQLDRFHPGSASLFAPLKTAASRRTVPIPEDLISILAAHLAEFGEGQCRLIFATHAGSPVPQSTLHLHLQRAAKAAGLPAGTSYHALRHTYASLLMATPGLSPVDVQHRLGHANANVTLNVYGHLMPTSDDRTRAALENALRDYRVDADDLDGEGDDLDGEGV